MPLSVILGPGCVILKIDEVTVVHVWSKLQCRGPSQAGFGPDRSWPPEIVMVIRAYHSEQDGCSQLPRGKLIKIVSFESRSVPKKEFGINSDF